jgi:predicted peptidase
MYKLYKNTENAIWIFRATDNTSIPVHESNSDYAIFKKQIIADSAQLEDADGNLMSPDAAKAYVATLP